MTIIDAWAQHPTLRHLRKIVPHSEEFTLEQVQKVRAAYFATITYLDSLVGRLLLALDDTGMRESTQIIYTSDHGESMGARGLFGKFTMYEESAAVPFIMTGPDVPAGKVVNTPISLVDCFPTIVEAVGA